MLNLKVDQLARISDAHGLSLAEVEAKSSLIPEYLSKIEARGLGFYKVIDDQAMVDDIKAYAEKVRDRYENIVVCAIGGSSLGTICLQQSLQHLFGKGLPRLTVLDNIDPVLLAEYQETIDVAKTLFIVVTKSGGTPETLSQFMYFRSLVKGAGLAVADHFVFITDPEKGLLRSIANQNPEIQTFPVPQDVGGRFSVLTPVGLLPAALMGMDIDAMLQGARAMRDQFMNDNAADNLPFQMAAMQYLLEQKGKTMNVVYSYAQKLIRFSDWYRQLLAESIGKAVNNAGEKVHTGITPVFALGATDQHSQNQLYNEGPNDKFFIFLSSKESARDMEIPFDDAFAEQIGYLKGVSFDQLLKTEMQGTMDSLVQNDRPLVHLELDRIDEEHLGQLFLLFECATAFLGEFYEINAFDQPGVELSKQLTKQYLTK